MSESGGFFGPALPPGYGNNVSDGNATDDAPKNHEHLNRKRRHSSGGSSSSDSASSSDGNKTDSSDASEGPGVKIIRIESGISAADPDRFIGPVIPKGHASDAEAPVISIGSFIGPALPASIVSRKASAGGELSDQSGLTRVSASREADDDDDDVVGPMPNTDPESRARAAADEIEHRAKLMKDRILGQNQSDELAVTTREEWMTELPPELSKNFGVTSRTFSTSALSSKGGDRSAWTDTPVDRARKEKELKEGKVPPAPVKSAAEVAASLNDESYREEVDAYNRLARPKSLMEIHTEKLHHKSHKHHHRHHHHSKKKKKKKEKGDGDGKEEAGEEKDGKSKKEKARP